MNSCHCRLSFSSFWSSFLSQPFGQLLLAPPLAFLSKPATSRSSSSPSSACAQWGGNHPTDARTASLPIPRMPTAFPASI